MLENEALHTLNSGHAVITIITTALTFEERGKNKQSQFPTSTNREGTLLWSHAEP
jgi:hypothetical protein